MLIEIFKYLGVFLILALIYHHVPYFHNESENLFIILGLVLFYILNSYLMETFSSNPLKKVTEEIKKPHKPEEIKTPHKPEGLNSTEIRNHVQNIIKHSSNKESLDKIHNAISQETNNKKKTDLLNIYHATVKNPVTAGKIATDNPHKLLESTDLLKNVNIDNNDKSDMRFTQGGMDKFQKPIVPSIDDDWNTDGFTILDPKYWRPRKEDPIDIYQENVCPVCPSLTSGYPVNLLEFDQARRIISSDNISEDYVRELNRKKL